MNYNVYRIFLMTQFISNLKFNSKKKITKFRQKIIIQT